MGSQRGEKVDYILATDGSCRISHITGRSYAAYAGVIVNLDRRIRATYSGLTNGYGINFSEGEALYMGLSILAHRLAGREAKILVVCDSKQTIAVVNAYIPYLWNTKGDVWKTSSGKAVENQGLYKMLKRLMVSHPNMHVKLVHVKSHMDIASEWPRTMASLSRWKVTTSKKMVKFVMRLNHAADELARRTSENSMAREERTGNLAFRILPKGGST